MLKMFPLGSTHAGDALLHIKCLAFLTAFPRPTPWSCCLAVLVCTAQECFSTKLVFSQTLI